MFKIAFIIVILIFGAFVTGPIIFQQFAIWDAANPGDDKSQIHDFFYSLTPHAPPGIIYESAGQIVDVRSETEYKSGYIKGSVNIPEETLFESIPKQFPNKNTLIYLYCDTGQRGAVATRLLRSMGYEKAINIEGGLKNWQRIGFPVAKPNSQYF